MNGRGFGVLNVATGISLLPETRDSRPLFIAAISCFVCGLVVFTTSLMLTHISRKREVQLDEHQS